MTTPHKVISKVLERSHQQKSQCPMYHPRDIHDAEEAEGQGFRSRSANSVALSYLYGVRRRDEVRYQRLG
jgi:hypothetical protein